MPDFEGDAWRFTAAAFDWITPLAFISRRPRLHTKSDPWTPDLTHAIHLHTRPEASQACRLRPPACALRNHLPVSTCCAASRYIHPYLQSSAAPALMFVLR
jgi:hypothetical protein